MAKFLYSRTRLKALNLLNSKLPPKLTLQSPSGRLLTGLKLGIVAVRLKVYAQQYRKAVLCCYVKEAYVAQTNKPTNQNITLRKMNTNYKKQNNRQAWALQKPRRDF